MCGAGAVESLSTTESERTMKRPPRAGKTITAITAVLLLTATACSGADDDSTSKSESTVAATTAAEDVSVESSTTTPPDTTTTTVAPTTTAIAVSVPFQLEHAGDRLENSFSRVYQKHLISACQQKYQQKFESQTSPLGETLDVKKLDTFYTFDNQVTAPLHGFKGADDYYQQCSSRQFLKHIEKPTLVLHAIDDPFMWEKTIPDEDELSPSVVLELSETGGHVGFVAGTHPFNIEYWVDKRIMEWLRNIRSSHTNSVTPQG